MEFELGLEVLIPEELRQSHLPWSYRYYDPIILLIQEKLSKDRRDFSQVKKQLGLIFDKKLSLAGQTKDLIGTKSDGPKKKKMKTQQQNVDLKKEYIDQQGDIDHHRSKHIMMLQRSNYISMQEPRKTLQFTEQELKDEALVLAKEMEYIREIDVQFLKNKDVEKSQKMTLLLKSQFLYKLQTFKNQGKQILLMNKIGKWIEKNIHTFFKYDEQKSLEDNYFKQRKR